MASVSPVPRGPGSGEEAVSTADKLTIPGEERLSAQLRQAARAGTLGQAVILSGQGDLLRAARFAAAAMECQGEDPPCGVCPACRKVLRDIHPDVITVRDPDHKNIAVEVLRSVRADAYILPNEGRRKVYLFPDCALLDPKAQNVLLKVLEEGPPHAAFLFCAENSAQLLPTIRSRCVEWRLSPPPLSASVDSDARRLCELLCDGRAADMAAFWTGLENSRIEREALGRLLSDTRDLLCAALALSWGAGGSGDPLLRRLADTMGRRRLSALADTLGDFARQCGYNVGVGHLTGALAAELID